MWITLASWKWKVKLSLVNFQLYRLIDEALGKEVKVAVCSTSNEKAVSNPAIPTLKCFRRGYVGLGVTTYIYNIQENNIFQFWERYEHMFHHHAAITGLWNAEKFIWSLTQIPPILDLRKALWMFSLSYQSSAY